MNKMFYYYYIYLKINFSLLFNPLMAFSKLEHFTLKGEDDI